MSNTEFWGNKADGIRVRMLKLHLLNGKIKQNMAGAIFIDGKLTEQMVKLYAHASRTRDINGKIYSDTGLVYPKIMIHEEIGEILDTLRN